MRTRETIEAQATDKTPSKTPRADRYRGLVAPWKPGQSGNPGGRPRKDVASDISRAIFEQNPEIIYKAYTKALAKGQAFAFQVLADRAYGKLKETVEHIEGEVDDTNLEERVAQLERDLYPAVYPVLTREAGEAARAGSAQSGTEKTNGKAKDPDVLPR